MCYSAEASFVAGAALIPAGGYCIASALRKRPNFLPLALVPLVFGLQQISEGFVWIGIERSDPNLIRSSSLVFLFFALAFWPFWFPFLTAVTEPLPTRRKIWIGLTIVSATWFWILYFPIITGPESLLTTRVEQHSIQYDFSGIPVNQFVPKSLLRLLYFLCVALPMAFGSAAASRTAGLLFGASALVSALVYSYAFVSVWCLIASLLSAYLCYTFYSMPQKKPLAA
jgi:hypothetical protein